MTHGDDPSSTLFAASPAIEEIEQWVRQAKDGQEEAFGRLIEIFAPRLQAMIYRMVLDWDETRDVAQETFVSAYQALSRYDGRGRFQSWLFRIGARKALDLIRKRKHHPESRTARSGEEAERIEKEEVQDSTVARSELIEAIERAVGELPDIQRAAFVLAEYEGCGHREIAEAIGGSEKSVEMHLYRARAFLRERLKDYLSL